MLKVLTCFDPIDFDQRGRRNPPRNLRPKQSRRFAKPVIMANGTRLASPADALKFLSGLPAERVTAPLYYAAALVNDVVESGRAKDVEKARLELIRALRGQGWM
jgi:hypothetical protein